MHEITETTKRIVKLKVEPCIKCSGTDVKTWDCGYSAFNVCGVTCIKCGRKVKTYGDGNERDLIKEWNRVNGKLSDGQKLKILREQIKSLNADPIV